MSINRRSFIKGTLLGSTIALGGVAGATLTGCATPNSSDTLPNTSTTTSDLPAGTYSFEIAPGDITAEDIHATEEYDVIVIGAGISGLCAAASAAEEGLKTVCLEKFEKSAGSGMYFGFINSDTMISMGSQPRDASQVVHDLLEFSQYASDAALTRRIITDNSEVCEWMLGIARDSGTESAYEPHQDCVFFGQNGDESAVYAMMTAYAESNGAQFAYNTEVVRILRNAEGKVSSVIARTGEESYTEYRCAKGIILCTGHYGGNDEMTEKYIPWAVGDMLQKCPTAEVTNTGDGLKMALWADALIGRAPHCAMIHFIDGATPVKGILYVNKHGERFVSGGCSMEFIAQQVMRQKDNVMYQVWGNGYERPKSIYAFGDDYETFTANTLDELAALIEVDAEGLKATVARWNELVKGGADLDLQDDFSQAMTVEEGPFSAQLCPVGKMAMMGGPVINANMQVLDSDYEPIEGFFAAGTCTSGFWGLNYPTEVKMGIARNFCATSGYLAAKEIAR